MGQRKYSVAEIDRMRAALDAGIYGPSQAAERTVVLEERLRTYMLNGTEPEELEESIAAVRARAEALREEFMLHMRADPATMARTVG